MELITTHTNADFDTLASMLAAKKLYPRAKIAFSGSTEKTLTAALRSIKFPYEILKPSEVDTTKVTRLILVDIKSPKRLGHFSELALNKNIEVHIFDHHPKEKTDIKSSFEVIKNYGSTTSIMVELLKKNKKRITAEEATIMMTGIYEDTGNLTYPSTTTFDYSAASYLLEKGADLSEAAKLISQRITRGEVTALKDLLDTESTFSIGGVDVTIATVFADEYKGDISTLAHRLIEIEEMECLFLLADTGDRVHVVARSSAKELNAGAVLKLVGGGGHPQAASATLKNTTLLEAKEKVLASIKESIIPLKKATDIMTSPVITVTENTRLENALTLMRRFNINSLPVIREKTMDDVTGLLNRQLASKAVHHGLKDEAVSKFMSTEFETVRTNNPLEIIREKIAVFGQRILPVMKGKRLVGVITRSDVLKVLNEELTEKYSGGLHTRKIAGVAKGLLPQWALSLLKDVGRVADTTGLNAYAVGGLVRDLILKRKNLDIDIVVEPGNKGDAITFAKKFAKLKRAKVKTHERFKTAVITLPDGFKIDVATARLEYYEHPGALPTVEKSSLKLDLYRRDFTINTLAMALNEGVFGTLYDYFGALADIKNKKIRVLHNLSFIEDPTRALRAVRFATRFGFELGAHTTTLLKNTLKLELLKRAFGSRLQDEVRNILQEEEPEKILSALNKLDVLKLIHPSLKWDAMHRKLFKQTQNVIAWHTHQFELEHCQYWLTLFMAMTSRLKAKEISEIRERLCLNSKKIRSILEKREEARRALTAIEKRKDIKNSEVLKLLSPYPIELALYLMSSAESTHAKKILTEYLSKIRKIKPILTGSALQKLGVSRGPLMGKLLGELMDKKVNGEVPSRDDEIEFIKKKLVS
ncbi:MAG: CBS domain-containing protein [Deltaproteobacteria bacterium]|nr:CBS domain-containing protein [Deltaproteobacteria bacterium]